MKRNSEPNRSSSRLLDWSKVKERVPYTRQHVYRLERIGEFPARVQVGANRVAWLESDIDDWIAGRAAERDQPEAA